MDEIRKIVLCAEDDPDDKELFCEAASEIDSTVEVIHADNGLLLLGKLELLTSESILPCLIVLDMNMPIMGGREAVENIRQKERWANIPICLYTTSPPHFHADLEMKHGVVVVKKPDNVKDIRQTVKFMLSYCGLLQP